MIEKKPEWLVPKKNTCLQKLLTVIILKKITSQQFPVFIASGLCSMQALEHFKFWNSKK